MLSLGWNLHEISKVVGGRLVGDGAAMPAGVTIDSREDVQNLLFVALVGDRFDGHRFVESAAQRGACAALVETAVPSVGIPLVVVDDTLAALQKLAAEHRRRFGGLVAAVTGSSGKTTTRGFIQSVMGKKWRTHAPVKNFNNHVGVPLTALALRDSHEAAVFELGCSDFGEIGELTAIVDPDVGLITNIGPAHLEKLGDLEGVLRAKTELFAGMRPETTCVINLDDPRLAKVDVSPRNRIAFGVEKTADVRLIGRAPAGERGQRLELDVAGAGLVAHTRLLGAHNAQNALAAAAVGLALGLDPEAIGAGIESASPAPGRSALIPGRSGVIVIDDTYNANPASMRAALAVLEDTGAAHRKRTAAVLGDMLELGAQSEALHEEIGRLAGGSGLDFLAAVGPRSRQIARGARDAGMSPERVREYEDAEGVADDLLEMFAGTVVILVKGSRGMRMERIVARLAAKDD